MNASLESLRKQIAPVAETLPDIQLCVLYGSAARDRQHASSDIDIAVAGRAAFAPDNYLSIYQAFCDALKREIDLLDLHTAHGLVLSEALTKGIIVVRRDTALLARFMQQVVCYNENLHPSIDRLLERRVERFIHG